MALSIDDVTTWASDQVNIFYNLAKSLGSLLTLIKAAAYIMGLGLAFKAVYVLKVYGESRTMMASHTSFKEPVLYMMAAAFLIYLPTGIDLMLATAFGESGLLQYASYSSSSKAAEALFGVTSPVGYALTLFMQLIGLIAFIHGWVLIARSGAQGQPPGGTGKGLMHIFGGVLAMNIVKTMEIINNTFYGT